MKLDQALTIVEEVVQATKARGLNQAEKLVLLAAWEDLPYKEVSVNSPYTTTHLQRYIGAEMWRFLSEHLGQGEEINKKNFRWFIEQGVTSQKSIIGHRVASSSSGRVILEEQLPSTSNFYGRLPLLAFLHQAINEDRCVVLKGPAGIGKSALASKLIQEIQQDAQSDFETIIWKPIYYPPPFATFSANLIRLLIPKVLDEADLPSEPQERITVLLEQLKARRTLLVLDGAEAILRGGRMNHLYPYGEFAEYGNFIRSVIETPHQSCVMLTSREPFSEVKAAQERGCRASCVDVEGLGKDGVQILQEKRLQENEEEWGKLIATYRGNPLALKIVASRIQMFFGGSVQEFREFDTLLVNDIFKASLDELFGKNGRLTALERKIMRWVAQAQEAVPFKSLLQEIKQGEPAVSVSQLIEALEALEERSMIEHIQTKDRGMLYSVQPVIQKYVLTEQSTRSSPSSQDGS